MSRLGSISAQIITQLLLARENVAEALQLLRDERRAQCNLLQVLSAARFKILTKEGLCDTQCPLQACRARDPFEHMLQCYDLQSHIALGEASVTFRVKMARKTQIHDPEAPRLYLAVHRG